MIESHLKWFHETDGNSKYKDSLIWIDTEVEAKPVYVCACEFAIRKSYSFFISSKRIWIAKKQDNQ